MVKVDGEADARVDINVRGPRCRERESAWELDVKRTIGDDTEMEILVVFFRSWKIALNSCSSV